MTGGRSCERNSIIPHSILCRTRAPHRGTPDADLATYIVRKQRKRELYTHESGSVLLHRHVPSRKAVDPAAHMAEKRAQGPGRTQRERLEPKEEQQQKKKMANRRVQVAWRALVSLHCFPCPYEIYLSAPTRPASEGDRCGPCPVCGVVDASYLPS